MQDYFVDAEYGEVQHEPNYQLSATNNYQLGTANNYQPDYDTSDNQFEFVDTPVSVPASTDFEVPTPEEDEIARRIREQEESIIKKLKVKTDEEHQAKLKRKEAGRMQLEQFNATKAKELLVRKEENIEAEKRKLQELRKLGVGEGWAKVAASISTKQGEYKGKKDVNRMRQAILHKFQDSQ